MRLVALLFLSLLIGTSCGNDDEPEKDGNCLTAVVNGNDFNATSTTGTFVIINVDYENIGEQETKLLTIIGTIPSLTSATETITLAFACSELTSDLNYVSTDEECGIEMDYNLSNFINPSGSVVVETTEGSINVEEVSEDHIKGTFNFKGEDQNGEVYEITNGFFDTTIQ